MGPTQEYVAMTQENTSAEGETKDNDDSYPPPTTLLPATMATLDLPSGPMSMTAPLSPMLEPLYQQPDNLYTWPQVVIMSPGQTVDCNYNSNLYVNLDQDKKIAVDCTDNPSSGKE